MQYETKNEFVFGPWPVTNLRVNPATQPRKMKNDYLTSPLLFKEKLKVLMATLQR